MDLYVIRHAEAFDRDPVAWPDDRVRPLTPKGVKRWRRAARGLGRIVDNVEAVLSSPLTRAWETAKHLRREAEWPAPIQCDALEPGRRPEEALSALRAYGSSAVVALVGHEPDLHMLTSYLLSGVSERILIDLDKGACAYLSFPGGPAAGEAALHWILMPKALRALRV